MDLDQRDLLSNILGFSSANNLGKYLGFPLKHAGAQKHDFDFMLDRVKKKLTGWKANLLSMADRLVLIHASSSTIPNYVMQQASISNKILKGIDRVNRNFLWGFSDQARKMHWVKWDVVSKPKVLGGLGLQSTRGRNTDLLAKLNWRFHTENDAPWAKVLKYKYCTRQRINSRNEAKLPSSPTWKGLKIGEATFKKGLKWIPSHESNLDFWSDCWSNLGSIRALIQGPLPLDSVNLKLKDVISLRRWDWSKIPFNLPLKIKDEIQATPIPLIARNNDKLAWKYSPKGSFDIGSAYLIATNLMEAKSFAGSWIWKLQTLPRIQMFIWRCPHNSVAVKEVIANRGILLDTSCPMCHSDSESLTHALRDCSVVKPIWLQLGTHYLNPSFFSQGTRDWLISNSNLKSSQNVAGIP